MPIQIFKPEVILMDEVLAQYSVDLSASIGGPS